MASNSAHEKGGKKKSHHTSRLFIYLLRCSTIHGIGEKLYLNPLMPIIYERRKLKWVE